MTNFISLFPLGLVVYPGEQLNLHIFEPRYKQLINECFLTKKPFGIPVVIEGQVQEYGTLVEIIEISKVYENGEMDIKTGGSKLFRLLEIVKEIPDKLYSGGIVNYPRNSIAGNQKLKHNVLALVRELHLLLKVKKEFRHDDDSLKSYDIAHHVGFNLKEEYELLSLFNELHRLEYIKRHLTKIIPLNISMENLKEKIKLNGHFKNIKGFEFDI